MHIETKDMIKKKLLDAKEDARDFKCYAEEIQDSPEVVVTFNKLAHEALERSDKLKIALDSYEENLFNFKSIH